MSEENKSKTPEPVGSTGLLGVWRDINTAPVNDEVLLYCPERHFTNKERVEIGVAYRCSYDIKGNERAGSSAHAWATHWMHPPSPPNSKDSPSPKA
jgi:hypothetical protein